MKLYIINISMLKQDTFKILYIYFSVTTHFAHFASIITKYNI